MQIRYFIGVDISKATLDWAVFDGKTICLQIQSENTEAGIKATLKLIKDLPGFKTSESVCCAEHTAQAALRHIQCPFIELPAQALFSSLVRKQFTD